MNRKAIAAAAVFAMLVICAAPLAAGDADAAETREGRVSDMYIWGGSTTIPENPSYYNSVLFFVEGSENHAKMLAYLEDPTSVSITEDDKSILYQNVGKTAYVYEALWYSTSSNWVSVFGSTVYLELILEPYNNTNFIATSGSTVTLEITSITTQSGEDTEIDLVNLGSQYTVDTIDVGSEYSFKVSSTGTYAFEYNGYDNRDLYIDLTYTVEGDSVPSGSATVFAAICFIIAAITVALVVLASMKPKWSK